MQVAARQADAIDPARHFRARLAERRSNRLLPGLRRLRWRHERRSAQQNRYRTSLHDILLLDYAIRTQAMPSAAQLPSTGIIPTLKRQTTTATPIENTSAAMFEAASTGTTTTQPKRDTLTPSH